MHLIGATGFEYFDLAVFIHEQFIDHLEFPLTLLVLSLKILEVSPKLAKRISNFLMKI